MGSVFEFLIVAEKERGDDLVTLCIEEVSRIERLLTEFSDDSQTAEINRLAGSRAADVDPEVYELIARSKHVSKLTQGAFDLSAAVLKTLYRFDRREFQPPTRTQRGELLKRVGWKKIHLLPGHRVLLKDHGMKIGFGAIGKGYAADSVKRLMVSCGVQSGVISASGDLTAWGRSLSGSPWNIGIANPKNPQEPILKIPLNNLSMATSGDYEKYFTFGGSRYSHTIDPKTALPVKGIKSVSVISSSAELSDALATALGVMGPDTGIHLVDQLPGVHSLFVMEDDRFRLSKDLHPNLHEVTVS